jgi:hypothetical protein
MDEDHDKSDLNAKMLTTKKKMDRGRTIGSGGTK